MVRNLCTDHYFGIVDSGEAVHVPLELLVRVGIKGAVRVVSHRHLSALAIDFDIVSGVRADRIRAGRHKAERRHEGSEHPLGAHCRWWPVPDTFEQESTFMSWLGWALDNFPLGQMGACHSTT